ncbi:MAG: hypothetical protein A2277_21320 [Desulfobacterales bacterium RIFOXYA12_FULL_46_15]|nr:MAG: hypothetical protein A2277_21320 [Desulfobacterales bacterium RIFOXYA12_FULL_46_15]
MYLIAEIGFNHNGDIELAKDMIHAASESGANAVKFQTFKASDIALPSSEHYKMIQQGELHLKDHEILFETSQKAGIEFLSTPFSRESVDLLDKIGVSAFKIASMDCTNKPFLEYIACTGKSIYLSTGMADLHEIAASVECIKNAGCKQLFLLHCISHYPAKAHDLNLDIIPFLKNLFNLPVGYSDHYPGIDACFAAVIKGAQVIETHFTLDKTILSGDHFHSATPEDLKTLRQRVELFNTMSGSIYAIYDRPDRPCKNDFRRGVYALKGLKKGAVISENDLFCTRPPNEFTPDDIQFLIGKILAKDILANHPILRSSIIAG